MDASQRKPRYDVRNDGIGPYAAFYCDKCDREYRSQPDIKGTVAKDVGRQAMGGLLRNIPLFGNAVADSVAGQDPRYTYSLTPAQIEAAWKQCQQYFHECPTCGQLVCPSCWDAQSSTCIEDSPRQGEIAEAEAQQAVGVIKGLAGAFGLTDVVRSAAEAAQNANAQLARCPNDGTLAKPGTKFCPQCGTAMVQPSAAPRCAHCGAEVGAAKFCPECGTKVEQAAKCRNCGAELKGAKFCPECGTKAG